MNRLAAALGLVILVGAAACCGGSGLFSDETWVLDSPVGHPPIEGVLTTLRVRGKEYGGFDGCNSFGGRSRNDGPIAAADGTFSAPRAERTLRRCDDPVGVMEQAEAYMDALIQGERYRLIADRLEIIDGNGETRFVFVR